MIDARLMRSQKNDVFSNVQSAGLDPSEFEWREETKTYYDTGSGTPAHLNTFRISVLVHVPTGYYCRFSPVEAEYSPGSKMPVEVVPEERQYTRTSAANEWLRLLAREVTVPDLWETAAQTRQLAFTDASTERFTTDEQRYIAGKLDEIHRYLLESGQLQEEYHEFVDGQFAYLRTAAERMGRLDWKNAMLGVLTNIVVGAVFAPDRTRELFRMASEAFGPMIRAAAQIAAQ